MKLRSSRNLEYIMLLNTSITHNGWIFLCLLLFLSCIKAQGVTTASTTTTAASPDIVLNTAFTSIALVVAILVIALIVAKVVDHCYDRASLRDDASDISEDTRKLIRARLALNKFKTPIKRNKKKSENETKTSAMKIFRLWSKKAKSKANIKKKNNIIKVDEAKDESCLPNGDVHKTTPKVTFIDEINETSTDDLGTPVFTITVPELKPQLSILSKGQPFKSAKSEIPLVASVHRAGTPSSPKSGVRKPSKETPVRSHSPSNDGQSRPTSGRSTPVSQGKAMSISPSSVGGSFNTKRPTSKQGENTNKTTVTGKQTPQKDVKKSAPVKPKSVQSSPLSPRKKVLGTSSAKSHSSKDLLKGKSPPKDSAKKRPQTAPGSGKVLKVKSAPSTTPTTNRNQVGPVKAKTPDLKSPNSAKIDVQSPTPRTAVTAFNSHGDDDTRGDVQKKFVHFRGDSDDLLIPVSTDERPKTVSMSYEKDKSSSSEDYEFLDDRGSPGAKNNRKV